MIDCFKPPISQIRAHRNPSTKNWPCRDEHVGRRPDGIVSHDPQLNWRTTGKIEPVSITVMDKMIAASE